jgi:hypothetical protein
MESREPGCNCGSSEAAVVEYSHPFWITFPQCKLRCPNHQGSDQKKAKDDCGCHWMVSLEGRMILHKMQCVFLSCLGFISAQAVSSKKISLLSTAPTKPTKPLSSVSSV